MNSDLLYASVFGGLALVGVIVQYFFRGQPGRQLRYSLLVGTVGLVILGGGSALGGHWWLAIGLVLAAILIDVLAFSWEALIKKRSS